jgi:hypothetical protein
MLLYVKHQSCPQHIMSRLRHHCGPTAVKLRKARVDAGDSNLICVPHPENVSARFDRDIVVVSAGTEGHMSTIACLAALVALMAAVISFFWAAGTIQKHAEWMQEALYKKDRAPLVQPNATWPRGGAKEDDGRTG